MEEQQHLDPEIVAAVNDERGRQKAKWGEQNWPSVPEGVLASAKEYGCQALTDYYGIPSEQEVRECVDRLTPIGRLTFGDIALEETTETISALSDRLRVPELIQDIAVRFQWLEAIRRNNHTEYAQGMVDFKSRAAKGGSPGGESQ